MSDRRIKSATSTTAEVLAIRFSRKGSSMKINETVDRKTVGVQDLSEEEMRSTMGGLTGAVDIMAIDKNYVRGGGHHDYKVISGLGILIM